ncbi:hypothetical protein [Brassicibacter mesophilus]|uniref:hypothetical protein n=1 Tax=Brassicibacter mesophilus TaxID=745119 RepID=UPI003D1BDD14
MDKLNNKHSLADIYKSRMIIIIVYIIILLIINITNNKVYNGIISTHIFVILCLLGALSNGKDLIYKRKKNRMNTIFDSVLILIILGIFLLSLPPYTHEKAINKIIMDSSKISNVNIKYIKTWNAPIKRKSQYFIKYHYQLFFREGYREINYLFDPKTGAYKIIN